MQQEEPREGTIQKRYDPVVMLKSLDDDSHVKRVCQHEALKNAKGVHIAKQFVLGKIEGQNQVLKKYGLRQTTLQLWKK